jgi:hypothetical protein
MEDVYTDCPLYEQTLWVGDMRNEALYGYYAFGATDIARNSLFLAAKSLDRYDIIAGLVPSCWDCLLPSWGFLWGPAVWEYFWFTGDYNFLEAIYSYVVKSIESTEKYINSDGLFSGPFWNLLDWAQVDHEHRTVLHNSMFLVGAVQAASKCANELGDNERRIKFDTYRCRLIDAINKCWRSDVGAYPDSVYDDGTASRFMCQHTSFLSIIYDIIPDKLLPQAIHNTVNPPENMVKVGSPFAAMFMYEAMEKYGMNVEIIDLILKNYKSMLDEGATTVWESFSTGTLAKDQFPTRSHCHGWSAAPVYFFGRIILGVSQTAAGSKAFKISPYLCGLNYAKGIVKTYYGDINVSWRINGKNLLIKFNGPANVELYFEKNTTIDDYNIVIL